TILILTPPARLDPSGNMGWKPVSRHFALTDCGASNRYTRRVHRFGRTGNERMPPAKVLALIDQPVGARFGKPAQPPDVSRCQFYTILNMGLPVFIVGASARSDVKKPTSKTRNRNIACVLVLKLDETALTAAVAQRLPFRSRHLAQAFCFPKGPGSSRLGR